ncbi:hypothetical protein QJS10_CPB04g00983 [Acorus calamus]|uniref:Uncharacterized protein n=1 Tax=Acorus calamus TaxID=4465 RepID=A0AAV9EYS5_ACOCL|nr:hypothetical protein QJS10_CPB04g00983 [Acorus calamus]
MKDKGEGDGGLIAHGQMIWDLTMKDWLLLENQIQFFVVKKVFQLFITCIYVVDHSFEELAINALEGKWYMGTRDSPPTVPDGGEEVHHLLHLFYLTILPLVSQPGRSEEYSSKNPIMAFKLKKKVNNVVHKLHCCHLLPLFRRQGTSLEGQDNTPPPPSEWFPSASSLKETRVKLKVINNARSFLDVKFHGGVMKIPTLLLHDNSELTFRNLIAFEQCYLHTGLHVSHYAIFMECLINNPQDVSILQEEEIILNHLGSEEEAARLFNKLAMEATGDMTKNHLSDVDVKVNRVCRKRMNKWQATLHFLRLRVTPDPSAD